MHDRTRFTLAWFALAATLPLSSLAQTTPNSPTPNSPTPNATAPASASTRARLVIAGDLDRLSQATAVERAIRDAAPNTTVEIVLAPAAVRIDVAWAMMKALRAAKTPTRVHLALDRLARDAADRATRPTIHPLALAIALRAGDRAIDPSARIMGAAEDPAGGSAGDDHHDATADSLIDPEISGASATLIRGEVSEWFERSLAEAPDGFFAFLWSPRDVSSVAKPLPAEPPADPASAHLWRQARLMQQYKDLRTGARISADPSVQTPRRVAIVDARTLGAMGVLRVEPLAPERDLATHTLLPASETLAASARSDLAAAQAAVRKAERALDLESPATRALAEVVYRRAIDSARNATREATRRVRAAATIIDAEPDIAALAPPDEMALATPAQRRARWKRELQGVLDDCARIEEKARGFEEAIASR